MSKTVMNILEQLSLWYGGVSSVQLGFLRDLCLIFKSSFIVFLYLYFPFYPYSTLILLHISILSRRKRNLEGKECIDLYRLLPTDQGSCVSQVQTNLHAQGTSTFLSSNQNNSSREQEEQQLPQTLSRFSYLCPLQSSQNFTVCS